MNIDFSKLSPMIREKLLNKMREILADEAGQIIFDLKDFSEDKNSEYYKEMTSWEEACWDLHSKLI